jgi:hypothetical protein
MHVVIHIARPDSVPWNEDLDLAWILTTDRSDQGSGVLFPSKESDHRKEDCEGKKGWVEFCARESRLCGLTSGMPNERKRAMGHADISAMPVISDGNRQTVHYR